MNIHVKFMAACAVVVQRTCCWQNNKRMDCLKSSQVAEPLQEEKQESCCEVTEEGGMLGQVKMEMTQCWWERSGLWAENKRRVAL